MNVDKLTLAVGIVALLSAFMPIAAKDPYYVNIHHLGLLTYMLYVLPLCVIGVSLTQHRIPFDGACIGLGVAGLTLSAASIWSGMQHLEFMTSGAFGAMGQGMFGKADGSSLPGLGGWGVATSYLVLIVSGMRAKIRASGTDGRG